MSNEGSKEKPFGFVVSWEVINNGLLILPYTLCCEGIITLVWEALCFFLRLGQTRRRKPVLKSLVNTIHIMIGRN